MAADESAGVDARRAAMSRRSQNGPTFTKAPPKRPALADEDKRLAAKSRELHQLFRTDMHGALQKLGLLKKKNWQDYRKAARRSEPGKGHCKLLGLTWKVA
jgi:hypothetical protein